MKKEHELFYLGGIFDGEGSFSIQISIREYKGVPSVRINPRMTLSLKEGGEKIVPMLVKHFGGNLYRYNEQGEVIRWNLSTRAGLYRAIGILSPKLIVKKGIALRFKEALDLMPMKRKNHRGGKRSLTKDNALAITKIAFSLNPYRKSKNTFEAMKSKIEEIYST